MQFTHKYLAIVLITCLSHLFASAKAENFASFIDGVKQTAMQEGVSNKTLKKYLYHLPEPKPAHKNKQIQKERHRAESVYTFHQYLQNLITKQKLKEGLKLYHQQQPLLRQVSARYGVAPEIITSLWGMESYFGHVQGKFPLILSLAYLAYDKETKSKYFREQLIAALKMLDQPKVIHQQLISSFDGGMGQAQLEPESYLAYAVDYDGDGLANIWTSKADVFASIANYLEQNGWKKNLKWGWPVKLPKHFNASLAGKRHQHPISYWRNHGVKLIDGKSLLAMPGNTAIILPHDKEAPAFLVTHNFFVLMRWNHTIYEALATGIFANQLGPSELSTGPR